MNIILMGYSANVNGSDRWHDIINLLVMQKNEFKNCTIGKVKLEWNVQYKAKIGINNL